MRRSGKCACRVKGVIRCMLLELIGRRTVNKSVKKWKGWLGVGAYYPVCGLNMVVPSSIAEKKSVTAFAGSAFDLSFDEEPSEAASGGVGAGDPATGTDKLIVRPNNLLKHSPFSTFFGLARPFLRALSAESLFALYSTLFCSKLGSFKYSSKDPTRDTGACAKKVVSGVVIKSDREHVRVSDLGSAR